VIFYRGFKRLLLGFKKILGNTFPLDDLVGKTAILDK